MEESPLELKGKGPINNEPFATAHMKKCYHNSFKIVFKADSSTERQLIDIMDIIIYLKITDMTLQYSMKHPDPQ